MSRRVLLFIAGAILFFAMGYLITSGRKDLPQGDLQLEVAPASATVTVDGRVSDAGTKKVDIGPHKIRVALSGFRPYETSVNINQADATYVGVILRPVSADTKDWYENHPDDQEITQSISDRKNDSQTSQITTRYPIFSRLPIVFGNGSGGLTKIQSEAALNNSGKPSIGIYASSPGQRQEALDWIYNRNYSVSDLDVVFHGANIPLRTDTPR